VDTPGRERVDDRQRAASPAVGAPLPAPPAHPPLVAGGGVVVASHDSAYGTTGYAHLAAFDAATGEPRWTRRFARSLVLGLQLLEAGPARLLAALTSSDLLAGGSHVLALDEAGETVWEWRRPCRLSRRRRCGMTRLSSVRATVAC
jgi:outer membrane protein assembly factor BamB